MLQNDDPEAQGGKRTMIASHCEKRLLEGQYERCIFLCIRRGRRHYAVEIPIAENDEALGLERLRKESGGLWKRHSLYSAIAVQEVNMRLMRVEASAPRQLKLQVCIRDINYDDDVSRLDKAIDIESDGNEPCDCGIDVNGKLEEHQPCQNSAFDEFNGEYCRVERARELRQQRSDYRWLPTMLEYFWQNGVDAKAVAFLTGVGFVHSFENLRYDTYDHAASPYGRTIPAFLLVEGWHVRYLLILIGVSLSGSGCIIAIVAALTQSVEIALTAGSYACGLAGALIAVFTFLSAIL